jgi:GNAT superfamily N-acetyltransferase
MELLARLQAYFRIVAAQQNAGLTPVVEPFAPADGSMVQASDLSAPALTVIFACTPATFCPTPVVPGLVFIELSSQSSLAEVQEGLDANAFGFDPAAAPATEAEAEAFRAELLTNRAFTARLDGLPVAAGMFTPPIDGIAELVGITTLAAYRRRGIAAAVTSEIARVAFTHGVDTAFLRTDNPTANRIYHRIGFRPVARLIP